MLTVLVFILFVRKITNYSAFNGSNYPLPYSHVLFKFLSRLKVAVIKNRAIRLSKSYVPSSL